MAPMSPPAGSTTPAGPQRGFIIVAVLWMLAALAILASVYAVYASNAAAASHVADDRLQTQASVLAGVELVAAQLTAASEATRPSFGDFALGLGRSKITVSYQSEGARIDLNAAPKELLANLFLTVGIDANRATYCANRIIAWRKKSAVGADDAEAFAYKSAGYAYPPRGAPFQNVRELSLVLGLSDEIVQRILPFVTVFNGRAEIDVAAAAPEVLASLPGMDPQLLHDVLAQRARDPTNGPALLQALGPARARALTTAGKAARMQIAVDLDNGRRVRAEVVILILEDGDEPYRVLSWRDDFDGPI
jgi:general secretion pathway protein K